YRSDRLWFPRLFEDPDFLREYIDRWFELRRGPLDVTNMRRLVNAQAAEITFGLATAQGISVSDWTAELNAMIAYLSRRVAWLDNQFFRPPTFSHPGGVVSAQFTLTITNTTGRAGTIYFTLDGSDPIDGNAVVYTGPIAFNASASIKSRIGASNGEWSALNEASYVTGTPAGPGDLVISEIMYHPVGDRGAEFLELLNINPSESLDLSLVRFAAGVEFTFPVGTTLAPGERILVVRDSASFQAVHGSGHSVAGEFEQSSALDNSGDRIVLNDAGGTNILNFSYRDDPPWPDSADGDGDSLVLLDPFSNPDHDDPDNWRSSTTSDGNPGLDDGVVFAGEPGLDRDGDRLPALLEHALGTTDLAPDLLSSVLTMHFDPDDHGEIRITRSLAAQNVALTLEWSDGLQGWQPVPEPSTLDAHLPGGRARFRTLLPAPQPARRYFRLRAELTE
nr:hypothetical protein [Akkermansiaceae bacterium]